MNARLFCACLLSLVLSCALFAQEQKPAPAKPQQEARPAAPAKQVPGTKDTAVPQTAKSASDRPFKELPYTPSLDLKSLDRTADPCNDLYQFACGGWKKNNPIPADQSRWSVYGKTHNENLQYLWGLLDQTGKATAGRSPVEQKTGDYFAACMDEAAIERAGFNPITGELRSIQKLRNKQVLAILLGKLHLSQSSAAMMFGFGADQDPGNSEQVIAFAFAGGLGLPDRDYYTKDDAKSQEIRAKYVEHVGKTLELVGYAPAAAAGAAKRIMEMETALAQASLTRVEQRDPYKIYHKMPVAKLQELTPSFDWTAYLKAGGAPAVAEINVTQPKFFAALEQQIKARPLGDWKLYLTYHLVRSRSPYLSTKFVDENFRFYRGYLRGVKQNQPRWKRCVQWVDRDLGEALGQVFVAKNFSARTKQDVEKMVKLIYEVMEERIEKLDWMTPATKDQAITKLHAMRNKIGYPEKWRDYSAYNVARGDFLGNVVRGIEFESRRVMAKIGKPVDRTEWGMTPPTVNAYYNPSMNDMNFPAGVLQPPLYDPRMDDAPNYGNTGATVGHELTHGFDDEGRQFDAKGNLRDWWTAQDAAEFKKRAACVADQYSQYTIVDNIKINGQLTLGEDVADLGGTILAYLAWKDLIGKQKLEDRDGFTPDQRFFLGFAQWACENVREEDARVRAITDPHSPGKYRINGVVVNMPEYGRAFNCKPDAAMVRPAEKVCKVW